MKILAIDFAILFMALLVVSASPATGKAEQYTFQVIFTSDLASDEIDAGDYDAAIKILEGKARDADSKYVDDELATLCGLYVLTKQLVVAHNTCDTAVASDRSYAAYNNRGVLRVHLKNVKGALDDFTHVRVPPEKRQLYIQELIRLDARLVANANYAECVRYAENRTDRDPNEALSERTKGAEVEEIIR